MKRTHLVTVLIMILALTLGACSKENAPEGTTAAATVSATAVSEAATAEPLTLTDWSMSASTWSSPNGATVHITATPSHYEEGQSATFVVRLESEEVASVPCEWDGTNYTASVDLNAANDYCYYVVLAAVDGTASEVAVNTPAAPTDESLINLEASLSSYCNIIITESSIESNKLTLVSGNVQVQAPILTNEGETTTCQEAVLILLFNDETLEQKTLALTQSETNGLFEANLENIVFDIPQLEADQSIDLTLQAVLSNGQTLSAFGGNWFYDEEGLVPVVG